MNVPRACALLGVASLFVYTSLATRVPPASAGARPPRCPSTPRCDGPPPSSAARAPWRHTRTRATTMLGPPRHRARDLFVRAGEPQWAIAKFAYGPADTDLHDEDVELWLQRGCSEPWQRLGVARTTMDGQHPTVTNVTDDGGRVFFQIPTNLRLDVGWHRVRFVVLGDGSATEGKLRVLPQTPQVVVTDVDGTLTENEFAEFPAMLAGTMATAHPGASELLSTLSRRGFDVLYLTARPEWLLPRTREWLALRGFPPGVVHTTTGPTGFVGDAAEAFKTDVLRQLRATLGTAPSVAFGNMPSDVRAYRTAGIDARRAFFFRLAVARAQGTRHDDYRAITPQVLRATAVSCIAP